MEFPQDKFKPKNDRYAKSRGGPHIFLYIACAQCEEPAMVYQKDGPGKLLRCYSDRIFWPPALVEAQQDITSANIRSAGPLGCTACGNVIGNPMIYEREDRPAYRVVPGSIQTFRTPPAPEQIPVNAQ